MLTDIAIRTAKPKDKSYRLFDGDGLYLEIYVSGSKLWRWKYRFLGKEKRLSIGRYPDTKLAEARRKVSELRKKLEEGIDPAVEKKASKENRMLAADNTFEGVARQWCDKVAPTLADSTRKK